MSAEQNMRIASLCTEVPMNKVNLGMARLGLRTIQMHLDTQQGGPAPGMSNVVGK